MPVFPDYHLPSTPLLLVLTSLLFLLSLLLCLPLHAVSAHTVLSWGQFSAQKCGKRRERLLCPVCRVQLSRCGNTCLSTGSPGTVVQEHRIFPKPWARRVHVKSIQVQVDLKAFQMCFPVVNLHIHLHIRLGKSQATRSALFRVTGLPLQ